MTRDLSHDEASESLAAAALDALPAAELQPVLAHAAICPQCGPELQSLREAAAGLAFVAPAPDSPDISARLARIRKRVLARAAADVAPPPQVVPIASRGSLLPWLALAACLLLAFPLYLQLKRERNELTASREHDAKTLAQLDSTREMVARRDRELQALTGAETEVVVLNEKGSKPATALMFWDRKDNSWTMYAHSLPATPPGKTYELWLLTPSSKIAAGTFSPSSDGSAEVHQTYALSRDSLKGVAVTLEPEGGSQQPTGPIVILGTPGGK